MTHRLLLRTRLLAVSVTGAVIAAVAGCVSTTLIDSSEISFSEQPLTGKVVWNDLLTDDIASARKFYGGLFGWTFEESGERAGHSYAIARAGRAYVAGILEVSNREDGKEMSRWLPFVSVTDVDEAIRRATASGARVAVGARDVPMGRVAAVVDPEGAVIGLARSRLGDPDDASTAPAIGRIVWSELLANDPEAAAKFYEAVVGYSARVIERRGGQYTLLTNGGTTRAGVLKNPSNEADPVWLTYFGVADPATATERVKALGGTVVLPPSQQLREGTIALVTDPTGALLVLQKIST
jgi:uncharacterized protein